MKKNKPINRILGAAAITLTWQLLMSTSLPAQADDNQWTSAGQNLRNTRYQSVETRIGVDNVANLGVKWAFTTEGDVSAIPAVDGTKVYVPDWKGNLYAVDRATGSQVWKKKISDVSGVPGDKARATPVISGNKVIIGTLGPFGGGGKMLAFDKNTGELLWKTTLDGHPTAVITQSAVAFNGLVYVGVSSLEEVFAASAIVPGYVCCSFRGSLLALDVNTGAIRWKTYLVPQGYTGGAVWGSSPAIDVRRSQVYIATGNNYSVPSETLECITAAGSDPNAQRACISPDDHFDSIVALDLRSGVIRWATAALPYDASTGDCVLGEGANCPQPAGPDFDFGQGPALFTVKQAGHGKSRDVVGAGQKSGQYWALDPDTGAVLWVTAAGPGGTAGGLQWGSAVDGLRVYTANANYQRKPWRMPDGSVVTSGMWSGLEIATGRLLWQVSPPDGGSTSGPVTTANGVVFGCSLDPAGHMYALNAATGAVLWQFASGGSCLSGAAISNGTVFWGSGYSNAGFGTPNNKLYAFEIK